MGSKEQQRSILYNLGHFPGKHAEVLKICRTYMHHGDADLRYDALVVFNGITETGENVAVYASCLEDDDPRIRELALIGLTLVERHKLGDLSNQVHRLVSDRSAKVRQAATRLIHHMESISLA